VFSSDVRMLLELGIIRGREFVHPISLYSVLRLQYPRVVQPHPAGHGPWCLFCLGPGVSQLIPAATGTAEVRLSELALCTVFRYRCGYALKSETAGCPTPHHYLTVVVLRQGCDTQSRRVVAGDGTVCIYPRSVYWHLPDSTGMTSQSLGKWRILAWPVSKVANHNPGIQFHPRL